MLIYPRHKNISVTTTIARTLRLLWPAIIMFFLCLPLVSPVDAAARQYDGKRVIRTEEMKELFRQVVTSEMPWREEDIRIKNFTVSQNNPALPQGRLSHRVISVVPERFLGRRYLTIIYRVNGRDQLQVKMSGDVHRYGEVFCAAGRLARGTSLESEDIITVYRDITMLGSDLPRTEADITGKVTKTTLQPGEIVYNRSLEKKEMVKRGEMVTIIAGSGPLKVSVPGEIENRGGALGEAVKVKNLMSRRIINARVIEEGVVRAGL